MTDKLVKLSDVEDMIKKITSKHERNTTLNTDEFNHAIIASRAIIFSMKKLLSSLSSLPTQNEGGDKTDADIIFDIKSGIFTLQKKYRDFELDKAYDAIANFSLPPTN